MRKVQRWRYYCEFCKKAGGSAFHIGKHERGCTNNPARQCGMCALMDEEQTPMPELLAAAQVSLEALREAAHNCPACILAGIRQARLRLAHENDWTVDFDFKKEREAVWAKINEAAYREEVANHGY